MVMKIQENKGKGRPLVWVLDEVWCGDGKCDLRTDQSQLRLLLNEVVQIGLRAEVMRGWQGKRTEGVGWVLTDRVLTDRALTCKKGVE